MEYSKEQLLAMGVIEYATQVLKLKLTPWQKTYLENMQTNPLPADKIFKKCGHLYGPRACFLVYERWKNRVTDFPDNEL
jgi:hypothetical protein